MSKNKAAEKYLDQIIERVKCGMHGGNFTELDSRDVLEALSFAKTWLNELEVANDHIVMLENELHLEYYPHDHDDGTYD